MIFTLEEFNARLPLAPNEKWRDGVPFAAAFAKGGFELEFFAPRETDYQTAHDRDKFYFIARGTADLLIAGEKFACAAGDALFVAAGAPHRFENISADFATWAVFF